MKNLASASEHALVRRRTHTQVRILQCARAQVHAELCTHKCARTRAQALVCTHYCAHSSVHAEWCARRCARIHVRTDTEVHTHTHTSVHAQVCTHKSLFHFRNLEQSSTEKAGIQPAYHEPFQEVVTSPLPAHLGAEQNFVFLSLRVSSRTHTAPAFGRGRVSSGDQAGQAPRPHGIL